MGLESGNMCTIWRGEDTAVMEGKELLPALVVALIIILTVFFLKEGAIHAVVGKEEEGEVVQTCSWLT